MRLIDADAIPWQECLDTNGYAEPLDKVIAVIQNMPTIEAESIKDTIYKFSKYQIEWLTSHNNITLYPEPEALIVHFLEETAQCAVLFGMDEANK